jgi:sensor histidine kinase regulating citrate/malate metabolism
MRRINLKLQTKLTIIVSIILFVAIALLTWMMISWTADNVQKRVEINILNIARIIANTADVSNALKRKDPHNIIQSYVMKLLKTVEGVDLIVIADMKGIRYAHPNPLNIGKCFMGGDDDKVLTGDTYISEAVGTLGKSLRAFVPIFDKDNKQVGFVMVGKFSRSIYEIKKQAIIKVFILSLFSMTLGILGAFLLAKNIKKTLLGLEPEQISRLYTEKKAMLNAIHEGVIAIDANRKITLFNDSALEILNIRKQDAANLMGRDVHDIRDFISFNWLENVLNTGISVYDQEQNINGTIIMTNRVPIKDGRKIVGAIATFRDKTMVTRLAEEITGVNQIIQALRANTHEFMNKLHVILGLIQIGEPEEAKKYINDVSEAQQQILSAIMNKIKDSTIAGLLLGKLSRAKELDIKIIINEKSRLEKRVDHIKCDVLITILGNFIENAFEAINMSECKKRQVELRIEELDDRIEIEVKDTGIGINREDIPHVFAYGFTTKDGNRGIGLSLVKELIERMKGEIRISSIPEVGTDIIAILPKKVGMMAS